MTQKEFVLDYLQSGKRITALKAMGEFSIMRLADVIYRLRNDGYRVMKTIKRTHTGKPYAEYYLA